MVNLQNVNNRQLLSELEKRIQTHQIEKETINQILEMEKKLSRVRADLYIAAVACDRCATFTKKCKKCDLVTIPDDSYKNICLICEKKEELSTQKFLLESRRETKKLKTIYNGLLIFVLLVNIVAFLNWCWNKKKQKTSKDN